MHSVKIQSRSQPDVLSFCGGSEQKEKKWNTKSGKVGALSTSRVKAGFRAQGELRGVLIIPLIPAHLYERNK